MVSHELNFRKLKASYYLVNIGLLIGITSLFFEFQIGVVVSVFTVVSGIFTFISFLFEAYKKRVKRKLDIGMKKSALSFLILIIPLLLVLIMSSLSREDYLVPMATAYGSALLIGFISSLIMGQTYKTLPFIVWLKIYRKRIGKGNNPFPKDLYSEKAATTQLWFFTIGFGIFLSGIFFQNEIIIRSGGMALFFSIVIYNWNILKIVLHKAN